MKKYYITASAVSAVWSAAAAVVGFKVKNKTTSRCFKGAAILYGISTVFYAIAAVIEHNNEKLEADINKLNKDLEEVHDAMDKAEKILSQPIPIDEAAISESVNNAFDKWYCQHYAVDAPEFDVSEEDIII
jgi:hypothetical protein